MGLEPQRTSILSPLERFAKRSLIGWCEPLFGKAEVHPGAVGEARPRRILVIRQHDQLGDFLLSTPALRALRHCYPEARIALVVREYFAGAAALIPFVDEVLVFHEDALRWSAGSFRGFWRALRSGWDLTIVLNTVSHSLTSDMLAHLSRAAIVLGSAERPFPGSSRNFFYSLNAPAAAGVRHQSERNLDILRYAGCSTDDLREELRVPGAEREAVLTDIASRGRDGAGPIIGFHIGAGKPVNRWPVERFVELATLLAERSHARILLFWGPAESDLKSAFVARARSGAELIGHPPIARLAAYFAACDAVVCNDTGVLHLAAAVGARTLGLYGWTNQAEWKPAGDHVAGLSGGPDGVNGITVDAAAGALQELLGRRIGAAAPDHH